jgi:hypothetical protein
VVIISVQVLSRVYCDDEHRRRRNRKISKHASTYLVRTTRSVRDSGDDTQKVGTTCVEVKNRSCGDIRTKLFVGSRVIIFGCVQKIDGVQESSLFVSRGEKKIISCMFIIRKYHSQSFDVSNSKSLPESSTYILAHPTKERGNTRLYSRFQAGPTS